MYSTSGSRRSDQARRMTRMSTFELDDVAIVVLFTGLPSWSHCASMSARKWTVRIQRGGPKNRCGPSSGWVENIYLRTKAMPRCHGTYRNRTIDRSNRFCFFAPHHTRGSLGTIKFRENGRSPCQESQDLDEERSSYINGYRFNEARTRPAYLITCHPFG